MQLEQQEAFEIRGPQLEVFGQAETKLPAPAKKRPFAAFVLALAVLLSVFGIGGAKLNGQYQAVRAQFSAANQYNQGLQNDLARQADAAASLIRVSGDILGRDNAEVQAAQLALDIWNSDNDADFPSVQYTLNRQLYSAVDTLYNAVAGRDDRIEELYATFVSAQATIDRAGAAYNTAVDAYRDNAGGFPGGAIATVWGIKDLNAFRAQG